MVLAAAANARQDPDNLQNAKYVKAVCKAREDRGRTTVRARAVSWEATDTDAPITPRWVANKVAANSVKVIGKAKYIAGETFEAELGNSGCRDAPVPSDPLEGYKWGVRGASWGDALSSESFRVVFGDDGFADFRYEFSDL